MWVKVIGLSPKQKAFAESYVKCRNGAEAARQAGYKANSAKEIGAENLTKPHILAYIKELSEPAENKRIADAEEIMGFFTSVMRGEIKDPMGLDPALEQRIKAAVELAKRTIDIQQRDKSNEDALNRLDEVLKQIGGVI